MTQSVRPVWTSRTPTVIGLLSVVSLFLGLGVWGTQSRIAGAVVARGMIQVESLRQVVQHPDGGVVGTIRVTDGDQVEAGDILIRFDDTLLLSEMAIVDGQLAESMARKARLRAERDGLGDVEFAADLLERAKTWNSCRKRPSSWPNARNRSRGNSRGSRRSWPRQERSSI